MLDYFLSFFSHDIGIDLGSANLRITVKDKGIMINEPTGLVRNKKTKQTFCVGGEAKQMIGRTPPQAECIKPIVKGAISDFDGTIHILRHYIEQIHRSYGLIPKVPKPKTVIAVAAGSTDVENKTYIDASSAAGSRKTILVFKPLCSILGIGLNLFSHRGVFIVDIGKDTTEIALSAKGNVILSKLLKTGSGLFDEAISNFIRLKYGVLIGEQTAEKIKISIGCLPSARKAPSEKYAVARGRDLESSLPRSVRLSAAEIGETLSPASGVILEAMRELLEKFPPDLLGDVEDAGIMLVGGGCQIQGLPEMVTESTKMHAYIVSNPNLAAVRGMQKALHERKILKKISL